MQKTDKQQQSDLPQNTQDTPPSQPSSQQLENKSQIVSQSSDPQLQQKDKQISRLQSHNQMIREQLKQLQKQLDEHISIKIYNNQTPEKKQLQIQSQQIEIQDNRVKQLEKQLKKYTEAEKDNQNNEYIKLQKQFNNQQKQLQDKNVEIQQLQRLTKQLENENKKDDHSKQIEKLVQQVSDEKQMLKKYKDQLRAGEKQEKKNQEYQIKLEKKYRDLCETFGVSPSINQTRAEDIHSLTVKNHEKKMQQQEKEEEREQKKLEDFTEENFLKQKELIKILQKNKESTLRQHNLEKNTFQKEISMYQSQIVNLDYIISGYKSSLLIFRHLSSQNEEQKINNLCDVMQHQRYEYHGSHFPQEDSYRDDKQLNKEKIYKIHQVEIRFQESFIYQINTTYKDITGEYIEVTSGGFQTLETQAKKITLSDGENILHISGEIEEKRISYLKISSTRNQYLVIGKKTGLNSFEFDIKGGELPISFFSSYSLLQTDHSSIQTKLYLKQKVLTKIGCEITTKMALNQQFHQQISSARQPVSDVKRYERQLEKNLHSQSNTVEPRTKEKKKEFKQLPKIPYLSSNKQKDQEIQNKIDSYLVKINNISDKKNRKLRYVTQK